MRDRRQGNRVSPPKLRKISAFFYASSSFTVFGSRIEDQVYGPPAASVRDANTIVSPTRVIEGFEVDLDRWRPHPQGRVIDHQTIWHPHAGIARFPMLRTAWATVDAAYRVALDVLHRSSTAEFIADEGDLEKWQSGFFMGKRFGFGIWMRDSTHVALRAGNRIDPAIARRTLIQMTMTGIDNGCEGVLMPIVGLCDYYRVTDDRSALDETWDDLKRLMTKIDAPFDPSKGLVRAAHSTSNVIGWGTAGELFLDGRRVEIIPATLKGLHDVELRVTPRASDRRRVLTPLQTGRLPVSNAGRASVTPPARP